MAKTSTKSMEAKLSPDGTRLILDIPVSDGLMSKSGKNMILATTNGNVERQLKVGGKDVIVKIGVNAYYPHQG